MFSPWVRTGAKCKDKITVKKTAIQIVFADKFSRVSSSSSVTFQKIKWLFPTYLVASIMTPTFRKSSAATKSLRVSFLFGVNVRWSVILARHGATSPRVSSLFNSLTRHTDCPCVSMSVQWSQWDYTTCAPRDRRRYSWSLSRDDGSSGKYSNEAVIPRPCDLNEVW